jgi:peptidyl-prolyl cis-trans isomerase B (cyclophilin B)
MKKVITALLSASLLSTVLLTGCIASKNQKSAISDYDYSKMKLVQLEELYEGQPIAVINTTRGVIKIALYPEYAPNTVKNFIDRVKEGFFDDSPVFGVLEAAFYAGVNSENEFKTTDDETIENEYSVNMWPFKGAVVAFGNDYGFSDSRFMIINDDPLSEDELKERNELEVREGQNLPEELLAAFDERGGAITISGFYTIFGQTINDEGFKTIEAICKSETTGNPHFKPIEDIRIINVELTYYEVPENEEYEN